MVSGFLLTLLMFSSPEIIYQRNEAILLAQRKAYDRGNCYQKKKCKGDSIGNIWMREACFCASQGGMSWMDINGKCHPLNDSPLGTECR